MLEWRICGASLLLTGIVAGAIAIWPELFTTARATRLLVAGHVVAAIAAREFLKSRITCVDMTQLIDYLVSSDLGALLLLGPSLTVLIAAATWQRLRRCSAPTT